MYSLLNEQEMKFYFSRSQTPAPTHVMCQLLVLCWSCYQQRHNELVTSLRRPHAPNSANIRHEGCEIKIPLPLCPEHEKIKLANPDHAAASDRSEFNRKGWQLCLFCATIWKVIKSAANS